jgi:sirohydrochlorin cobaltochelatase
MDQRIKAAYSGMAVRWAYTNLGSGQAETFMKTGERESPKQVLGRMEEEGIVHVAILPLAVIPSETYARLVWMVDTLR